MLRNPLFSKTLMIFLLALLLLIPLSMIQSKISERQSLQYQVQQDIARSASGPQTLAGPYLVLRYRLTERQTIKDKDGNEKIVTKSSIHNKIISPQNLKLEGNADVETRSRGIYQARLFNLRVNISGSFVVPEGYGLFKAMKDITPIQAYFVVNMSDARGIRNAPKLTLDGKEYEFAPGSIHPVSGNGIHASLKAPQTGKSHTLDFSVPLELQGMTSLAVAPLGKTTEMSLKSSWPHPSFGGSYLPRSRVIDEKGFHAQWLITDLARNDTGQTENGRWENAEKFSVAFIDPVNVYLLSERAVKYGILFIILIFTAFFMFEILRSLRIHPMQYLLVGLALAIFFLLIISLSEHMPFLTSYIISGTACAGLIGFYLAGVLGNYRSSLGFSAGIALLYAVLYGVLQSEDNALLMGTLVLFTALAAVMMLSRKMDWYRLGVFQTDNKE